MIEDLANADIFGDYFQWRHEWDGPLGPLEAPCQVRLRQKMADGQQAGAFSHKAALPLILSYGLSMDEHFDQSELLERSTPTEALPLLIRPEVCSVLDGSRGAQGLKRFRRRAVGILRELKTR